MATMATPEVEKKTVSVRSTRPNSYIFELKSFSTISQYVKIQNSVKYIESPEFDSGGHKWKLAIYPNGNEKEGVNDHISLYLVATDDEIDSLGTEIHVSFKMFVYDYKCDNFLTLQDNEVKRFHRFHKEFGFDKLILLEKFRNAKNGYLMNDCCVFGVEIFVLSSLDAVKSASFSMTKNPKGGTFSWNLSKFSTLWKKDNFSEVFVVQGHKWKLQIYPNVREPCEDATHLSMFLNAENLDLAENFKVYTEVVLRVKDQVNGKHHELKFPYNFSKLVTSGGYLKYISLEMLKNKSNGFIKNDRVVFEVEILSISETVSH